VGDRPWAAPRGGEAWGRGASTAVGQRGVAGSGPATMLVGGEQPAPKQGRAGLTSGPPLQSQATAF
jgi:hypothetical protein